MRQVDHRGRRRDRPAGGVRRSGDLTRRYLFPAIARLHAAGALPDALAIIGIDRENWDDERFRRDADARLEEHAADVARDVRRDLRRRLTHRCGDVTDVRSLAAALESLAGPAVFYLALPNFLFADALRALAELGMPAGSRLVIEKPFGRSAADARALNELIGEVLADAVFRIDRFLAEQTVLNLLGLRFANRVFEPEWNSVHVERVEIVWDGTLGLEGPAGYYDRAGALRDLVQNHLLQLLSLVAMEPPTDLGERALRREPPPYSLLLLEILDGQAALSVRGDEAEESWRIVEPVLAWEADAVPLEDYPVGSAGPAHTRSP